MKSLALHLFLVLCMIRTASGKAAGLPEDVVEKADLIAYVRVADNLDLLADIKSEKVRDPKYVESLSALLEEFKDSSKYREIATATPLQVFKGPTDVAAVKIRHTNGYGCPNVSYAKDKGYIVFLQKEAGSDCYVTMCYYNGQFPVEDGKVAGFYLMPRGDSLGNSKPPYEQVAAFLKEAVQKAKARATGAAGKSS